MNGNPSPSSAISSGTESLDVLIDGFSIGDNVVWEVEAGSSSDVFMRSFIARSFHDEQTPALAGQLLAHARLDALGQAGQFAQLALDVAQGLVQFADTVLQGVRRLVDALDALQPVLERREQIERTLEADSAKRVLF